MDFNIEDFLPKYPNINDFTITNNIEEKKDEENRSTFSFPSDEGDEGDEGDNQDEGDEGDENYQEILRNLLSKYKQKKRKTDYQLSFMNPYEDNFYDAIFKKKEFYDERLSETETIPTEKGMLMKHQKIISRFLSSYTIYDGMLLAHEMGSGKTCTAIAAIEKIKNERLEGKNNFKGCYIFAKGTNILNNFVKELRDKCTAGEYVPEGYFPKNEDPITGEKKKMKLTNIELNIRTKKMFENFYNISLHQKPTTFETIAKYIHNTPDNVLINRFSNCILVIDEVHNLRIQDVTEDKISMYAEFHRLLHIVKNCKILLLSGTPMKDEANEISSVMNLILPLDKQLPVGTDFENKYLIKNEIDEKNSYFTINKETEDELKSHLKGRVSFLKAMKSNVEKVFVGEQEHGNLKYLKVDPIYMSTFQTEHYLKALQKDKTSEKDKKAGVYYNSRQASLFVFPDGSYGQPKNDDGSINTKKGFSKYVKREQNKKIFLSQKKTVYTYRLDSDFSKLLLGENNEETIKKIEEYSCKYGQVLRNVLNSNKSCFIYCDQVSGSGAILLSKLFGLIGFSEATGKEIESKPRYVLLSSDMTSTRMSEVIDQFNNPKNLHGDIIKVIIGSKIVSEGLSFNNVQKEFILTPWFNYSETEQAIARGLRLGSHRDLTDNGEKPKVEIFHMVAMPLVEDEISIDQYMYEISELKDISIKSINRVLMTSSFDCALNYFRNKSDTREFSRDCEYQECNYACDGIDDNDLEFGFQDRDIDKSTYNVYYSNPKIPLVRRRIEEILRNYKEVSLKFILQKLEEEHTEYEIKNALKTVLKTTGSTENSIRYIDYIRVYNLGNVKMLINTIEKLFKNFFNLSLTVIKNKLVYDGNKNYNVIYTDFEIVTALKTIIDENIIMYNKYGLPSYLRENNDRYFLVSSVSSPSSFILNYYSTYPTVKTGLTFSESLKQVQKEILPKYIKKLSKVSDKELFNKMIKNIPIEVQEMFIEATLLEEEKEVKSKINQFVREYFSNYIFKVDEEWISTLLKEDFDILRCLQKDKWENCETDYTKKIKSKKQNVKVDLENNPWGYYAKINPENGVFNIVNVIDQKQKEAKKKQLVQQREEELKQLLKDSKITKKQYDAEMLKGKDHRDVFPGRNCREGWELTKLYEIVIKTLKLDFPSTYRETDSLELLKTDIKAHKQLNKLFTEEEIEKLDSNELRRALYWGRKETKNEGKTGGKIKTICDILEEWFIKNNLYVYDNEAGTAGGHKKKEDENNEEILFRPEIFTPSKHYKRMEQYFKYIDKVNNECLGTSLKVSEKDTNIWFLIFNKKKLASFIVLDPETNLINQVCVSKFFSKKEKAPEAVKEGMKVILNKTGSKPKIIVENNTQSYKELVKMYLSYGFNLTKNDGRLTTFELKEEA